MHPIIVCLEHEKTFHTLAVAGRHSVSHKKSSLECLEDGTFVQIGECVKFDYGNICNKNRLMDSTFRELYDAEKKLMWKKQKEKWRNE